MPVHTNPSRMRAPLLVAIVVATVAAARAAAQSRPAQTAASDGNGSQVAGDAVAHGEELYRANCQACHGDARTVEGGLAGAPVHGPAGHTWHHSDRNLTEIIRDGSSEMGDMMRNMM